MMRIMDLMMWRIRNIDRREASDNGTSREEHGKDLVVVVVEELGGTHFKLRL